MSFIVNLLSGTAMLRDFVISQQLFMARPGLNMILKGDIKNEDSIFAIM